MRRTGVVIAALLATFVLALGGVALAQEGYDQPPPPDISGETEERGPTISGEAEGEGDTLPFTGADITMFAVIGLTAIGTGLVLVRRARPQRNTA